MSRFVTSDSHFGHENIIKYTDRPFDTVSKMESEIAKRWNSVVAEGDVVYHVGDMCYQEKTTHEFWHEKLNGELILIRGNHDYLDLDDVPFPVVQDCLIRAGNGVELLLQHHPEPWDGVGAWLVHGHEHANPDFLALDRDRNMANVCVEKTNYYPIEINEIGREIFEGRENLETWENHVSI